jgi:hypothetical protein
VAGGGGAVVTVVSGGAVVGGAGTVAGGGDGGSTATGAEDSFEPQPAATSRTSVTRNARIRLTLVRYEKFTLSTLVPTEQRATVE